MSTKSTIVYANREQHGEDFHLYYDYADLSIHLEVNGKEVPLPSRLQGWIYNTWCIVNNLRVVQEILGNPELLCLPPVGAVKGDVRKGDIRGGRSGK